ncbi:hypothetical protein [Dubosiella newyorkensis]|uniref:hypothetical protein n=1 Tax=Dubosiella newyorkensis TaxID=1862672 RepID=UPI0023F04706|nr:hypothetical protein [Dubosiella newyorkensis]
MKTIRNGCAMLSLIGMMIILVHRLYTPLPEEVMKITSLILSICLSMVLFCSFTLWNEKRRQKRHL